MYLKETWPCAYMPVCYVHEACALPWVEMINIILHHSTSHSMVYFHRHELWVKFNLVWVVWPGWHSMSRQSLLLDGKFQFSSLLYLSGLVLELRDKLETKA